MSSFPSIGILTRTESDKVSCFASKQIGKRTNFFLIILAQGRKHRAIASQIQQQVILVTNQVQDWLNYPSTPKYPQGWSFIPLSTLCLQSWNNFSTSMQSATCIRFCGKFVLFSESVHGCDSWHGCSAPTFERYQGKTGRFLIGLVTGLIRATAWFSSSVFLCYVTKGLLDSYRTLSFQNPVNRPRYYIIF